MPEKAYAEVTLAYSNATRRSRLGEYKLGERLSYLSHLIGKDHLTLGQILQERIVSSEGSWANEPVFAVGEEEDFISLSQIGARLDREKRVRFYYSPGGWHLQQDGSRSAGSYRESFSRFVAATLAQLSLNIIICNESENYTEFCVLPGRPRELAAGLQFYPPLTFVPYESDLFARRYCSVNQEHPLARWLLGITPLLAERHPNIFHELRTKLITVNGWNRLRRREGSGNLRVEINALVRRLCSLDQRWEAKQEALLVEKDLVDL